MNSNLIFHTYEIVHVYYLKDDHVSFFLWIPNNLTYFRALTDYTTIFKREIINNNLIKIIKMLKQTRQPLHKGSWYS